VDDAETAVYVPPPPQAGMSPMRLFPSQGGASMVDMLKHLFPLHDNDAGGVMRSLLDTMVHGAFDASAQCGIRSPMHAELLLFGLLPQLPRSHQTVLLDAFFQLLARRARNRDTCLTLRLLDRLVWLLTRPATYVRAALSCATDDAAVDGGSACDGEAAACDEVRQAEAAVRVDGSQSAAPTRADHRDDSATARSARAMSSAAPLVDDNDAGDRVVRGLVDVLTALGSSPTLRDVRVLLSSFTGSHAPPCGAAPGTLLLAMENMLLSPSRIAAAFDMELPDDRLTVPNMGAWPRLGCSMCMWVRLEHPTHEAMGLCRRDGRVPMFRFQAAEGQGMGLFVVGTALVLSWWQEDGSDEVGAVAAACVLSHCTTLDYVVLCCVVLCCVVLHLLHLMCHPT
jgi:hypothetical protein